MKRTYKNFMDCFTLRVRNDVKGESSRNELAHSYCRAAKSCACAMTLKARAAKMSLLIFIAEP